MANKESKYYLINTETQERIPITIDDSTNCQVFLDIVNNMINTAKHFFYKAVLDVTDKDTVVRFMFTTPSNTTRINAKVLISANSEFLVEIYEGVETSNDGTPVTTFNNDRNSEDTPELVAYAAPTVTDEGTLIWPTKVTGGKSSGINSNLGYNIKAKTDTKYMFKITKKLAGTHFIDIDFFWYENTPD